MTNLKDLGIKHEVPGNSNKRKKVSTRDSFNKFTVGGDSNNLNLHNTYEVLSVENSNPVDTGVSFELRHLTSVTITIKEKSLRIPVNLTKKQISPLMVNLRLRDLSLLQVIRSFSMSMAGKFPMKIAMWP